MMYGININDREVGFTELILSNLKDVETRNVPSLRRFIGQRVGIVRTGRGKAKLVGYCTVSAEIKYSTRQEYVDDSGRHCVPKWSKYYYSDKVKYGYVLTDVVRVVPEDVTNKTTMVYREVREEN